MTRLVLPLEATTDYSAVIRPLQWLVVVIIFLFFLRIVRAVLVESRPAGVRPSRAERRAARHAEPRRTSEQPARRRRKSLSLEIVEPREYEGKVFELNGEVTIGRSPGCGIATSYDPYSSSVHARVFSEGGRLWVEDLGSTNGTFVNSERISQVTKLSKGDLLQVGATVFEVRR